MKCIAIIINNLDNMVVFTTTGPDEFLEKLEKDKYGMDFLVAALGNSGNKAKFIADQTGRYSEIKRS